MFRQILGGLDALHEGPGYSNGVEETTAGTQPRTATRILLTETSPAHSQVPSSTAGESNNPKPSIIVLLLTFLILDNLKIIEILNFF